MSSLLTSFIFKEKFFFYFHLFPLVLYTVRFFLNVALVVVLAVAIVEAAVGSVELQRGRDSLSAV